MTCVLNILSDTNIGGAGRVILNYLRFADRDQFRILTALPRGSLLIPELRALDVPVYEVDGLADRSYHRDDVGALRELITRTAPDLVHTHGSLSGRIAGRRCGRAVVYTRHSVFPVPAKLRYPPGRWVNKAVNEYYADHIIAVSPAAAKNLTDGGISPQKITVVMNGVEAVPSLPPEERERLRGELDLPREAVVFGIFARLEEYKGHRDLLEAARLLKERGLAGFRILIAGAGPQAEALEREIEDRGLGDVVRLLGFRSDVGALLNLLDVQLNASYGTEATSIALLEGMSLGLPTVASDYGGNPWLVEHGKSGLIFPARNPEALSGCMARLMENPGERESMSRRAREIFRERFTGEIFARHVEDVYRSVLKGD